MRKLNTVITQAYHRLRLMKKLSKMKFINKYYYIIIAFICLLYSVGLGLAGYTDEAVYSAHWPGTILLFSIALKQLKTI